jgi:hypothetical protein
MNQPENNSEEGPVPGLDRLNISRAPARDLWPQIEARLQPRRAQPSYRWLAAAACAVAVVGGMLVLNLRSTGSLQTPQLAALSPSVITTQVAMRTQTRQAPSTADNRDLIRVHLRVVDNAGRQLRTALKYDPDSQYLTSMLEANRQQRRNLHELLQRQT